MSWPLLGGKYASFDHVEMLINQYNYLSKLLNERKLKPEFATDLGIANFKNLYRDLLALIKLRQRLSDRYAIHFTKYYESSSDQ